jgi:hypothetical protein
MKKKTTEIFIEIEETIQVEVARRKNPSTAGTEEGLKPVIDICPHCHRAMFEPATIGPGGDSET